jgi:peptide chain release factor 3
MRRKQLDTGLAQLTEEGATQVFFSDPDVKLGSGPAPIVGAVGQLQFDVMLFRLESEYGAPAKLEAIKHGHPRWVTGDRKAVDAFAARSGRIRLYDSKGNTVVLFEDRWALRTALDQVARDGTVTLHDEAP